MTDIPLASGLGNKLRGPIDCTACPFGYISDLHQPQVMQKPKLASDEMCERVRRPILDNQRKLKVWCLDFSVAQLRTCRTGRDATLLYIETARNWDNRP
jgi:hypothetical protein